jgi:hypothetical protein
LRFGDPRVTALTGALCQTLLAATGFTRSSLRAVIAGLLGSDYRLLRVVPVRSAHTALRFLGRVAPAEPKARRSPRSSRSFRFR